MHKILIYTDGDLDGAQSALIIKWLLPRADITIKEIVTVAQWEVDARSVDLDQYHKVFVLDKHIPDSLVDILDKANVVIIDHHLSHVECKDRYKHAKVIVQVETSNAKLVHQTFKGSLQHLTPEQVKLIELVDDYDSYTLLDKNSIKLHIIHNSYNRPKVEKYIANWSGGFREFTEFERNAVQIYQSKLDQTLKNTQYFYGVLKGHVVISFVGDFAVNEVADFAIKRYNAAICIIVYPQSGRVSFRKNRSCEVDLSQWAAKLADGGGHPHSAGGKLTDAMVTITKTLTLCI